MKNYELFTKTFDGLMAEELWAMPEEKFLIWLNADVQNPFKTWRDEPATEKQISYCHELSEHSPYNIPQFTGKTKGEASDYIDKYSKDAHTNEWAIEHGYC